MNPHVSSSTLTCFLVEDNAVIRENLVATLEEMVDLRVLGHAIDENGALDWMTQESRPCDLLIIDIFLNQGTGLNVLQAASTRMPSAHRVILSNYATPDMRQRCLALGAHRVFDKSAELEDLLAYCHSLAERQDPDAAAPHADRS
ncbi:Response regulator receiver domain-containing protein [Roseateles sp. YR242]|uniref:response regulator n=1 Tax=Roseateles sp. YR242 TaxID=1855305 RepID=UPI0008D6674E|nr:response regulator [Roseateles sp. YR242]SEK87129.1 Response regulator receiver domain-containing protein [Roseateles sp. YR242]